MRITCWITKATNTHSEYVIFIAFPPQKWLHEHASILRYTQTASLSIICMYATSCVCVTEVLRWTGVYITSPYQMMNDELQFQKLILNCKTSKGLICEEEQESVNHTGTNK